MRHAVRRAVPLLSVLLASLFVVPAAVGNVLHVGAGQPYETIAEAVGTAANGDVVVVHPGTYLVRGIDYAGKAITIRSTNPQNPSVVAATMIQPDPNWGYQTCASLVRFWHHETRASILRGLTVCHAHDYYYGGGVRISGDASPTIEYCVFRDNLVGWGGYGGNGGGLYTGDGAPLIQYNTFANNNVESAGSGIYVAGGQAVIRYNTFTSNVVTGDSISHSGAAIGGHLEAGETVTIIGNTMVGGSANSLIGIEGGSSEIRDNAVRNGLDEHEYDDVTGIAVWGNVSTTITGNAVTGNDGTGISVGYGTAVVSDNVVRRNGGEGISCFGAVAEVTHNTVTANGSYGLEVSFTDQGAITGNAVTGNGYSGVYIYDGTVTASANTVQGNSSAGGGGGFHIRGGSNVTVTGNLVTHNAATAGSGGGLYVEGSAATLDRNTVANNSLSGSGSGAGIDSEDSTLSLTNTIIAFNRGGSGVSGTVASCRYCNTFGNAGGDSITLATAARATGGNICSDPLFADLANDDYHLRSQAGRWDPASSGWVADTVTSPCLNTGHPLSAYALEPAPNGGRVNMGAYGNTAEASRCSVCPPVLTWTGEAEYVSDGVAPDQGVPGSFAFHILYANASGTAAAWVRLYLWDPAGKALAGSPFAMAATGATWKSGVTFSKSVTLSAHGTYRYRFQASDGTLLTVLPLASKFTGPVVDRPATLSWAGTTGFESDGVEPNTGADGDTFTFRVKYRDADGDRPKTLTLYLYEGGTFGNYYYHGSYAMTRVQTTQEGVRAFASLYETGVALPSGSYGYYFRATGTYQTLTFPAESKPGPGVGRRGTLSWTGEAGYTKDGLAPNTAPNGSDIVFRAKYTDDAEAWPWGVWVRVYLPDGTEMTGSPFELEFDYHGSWEVDQGVLYAATVRFEGGAGTYQYRFEAVDGFGTIYLPASRRQDGPIITATVGPAALLTAAHAAPTPLGASLTYTLAAPAEVQAQVSNIAGRPLATLSAGKQEAGTRTLLWNGRGPGGAAVPSGTYLVRLRAWCEDGTASQALCTLALRR